MAMKPKLLMFLWWTISLSAQNNISGKITSYQQKGIRFQTVSLFEPSTEKLSSEIEKTVKNPTLLDYKNAQGQLLFESKSEFISLTVPYRGTLLELLLYKVNIFANGFHLDTDKEKNINYESGLFYRGCLKNNPNSLVSLNVFKNEVNGIISDRNFGNLVLGRLNQIENQNKYIVYADRDLKISTPFQCHTQDNLQAYVQNRDAHLSPSSSRCVTFYYEASNEVYVANNQDLVQTTNWITAMSNNVQTLFSNYNVTVRLRSIFIWTTPDPYDDLDAYYRVFKFAQVRPYFDADAGMLVDISGNQMGGLALGNLCSSIYNTHGFADINSIAYQTVPTYSWTVNVITHEFGHLLGSPHTHACFWNGNNTAIDGCWDSEGSCPPGPMPSAEEQGTIMSYCHLWPSIGVSFANGFGPQPGQQILNTVNTKTCLSFDCQAVCLNQIFNIRTVATTANTATLSWEDESTSTTSWQVGVAPYYAAGPEQWQTVSTTSAFFEGLSEYTYYYFYVRPACEELVNTEVKTRLFITGTDFCQGVTFTDIGGEVNPYWNNQNYTWTVVPNATNKRIQVAFYTAQMNIDASDRLYVFNGLNEFGEDLSAGGISGAGPSTNPITSTDPSGALTFQFISDSGGVGDGWVARIYCVDAPLSLAGHDFIDYSFFPNPTSDKVIIQSKNEIQQVSVYNLTGQLLIEHKTNSKNTQVNIAELAVGTYFFKVKIKEQTVIFKVLKM